MPEMTIDSVDVQEAPGSSAAAYSRSSTRTSTTVFDPLAMADFTKNAVSLSSNIDQALETTARLAVERKAAEQAQQEQILRYSKLIGDAATASSAVEEAKQTRNTNILNAGNINPDVITSQINSAFSIINSNAAVLEPLGREIDTRAAVGLYDNPLEFLINQTRLPGMTGEYNAVAAQTNRAVETVRTLQALAGTQQALSSAMDADAIHAEGVAKAAALASAATAKLTEAQVTAASAAARDAANMLAMSGKKYDIALDKVRLTKEQLAVSEGMSEADRKKAEDQIVVDRVNAYLDMVGGTGDHTIGSLRTMNSTSRTKLLELSGTGVVAKRFSVGFSAVDEFGNSARMAGEGGAAAVNWIKATIAKAKDEEATVTAAYTRANMKAPTGKDMKLETLDVVQGVYEKEFEDMRKASPSNPARLEYSFISKQPLMAGNKVAEFVNTFGPNSKTPTFKHPDEAVILDRLAAEVGAGTMTAGQAAAQVADFYSKAIVIQAEQTKYPLFGLPYTGNYMVNIPRGGLFNIAATPAKGLELTNPTAVEAYLTGATARAALLRKPASMFAAPQGQYPVPPAAR